MNIDSQSVQDFKDAVSTVMYNATITYWQTATKKDNTGFTRMGIDVANPSGSFLGNPIEQSNKRIMETYGLTEPFELAISCDPAVSCGNDSIVQYNDTYYKVINTVTTITHKLIVCEKWVLKQLPSVSA